MPSAAALKSSKMFNVSLVTMCWYLGGDSGQTITLLECGAPANTVSDMHRVLSGMLGPLANSLDWLISTKKKLLYGG